MVRHRWLCCGLPALALAAALVSSDERILSFESAVNVEADGWLTDVRRDGATEPFHIKSLANDVRVYVGREDVMLRPGVYTYDLTYRTNRQLGFFSGHDELYWNVTGNRWAFPIDRAVAKVSLPAGVPPDRIGTEAYTGRFGESGAEYQAQVDVFGAAVFESTRTLESGEGMTIVVTWPKGYVREPGTVERLGFFARDNGGVLAGIFGTGVLLLYYALVWSRVGRDPASGVIVPLFKPPLNLSPAAMRYIMKMGFDTKAYSAALIDLAVKGHLKISEDTDEYVLTRIGSADTATLSPGEKKLAATLFQGRKTAVLKRANHKSIRGSMKALKKLLRKEYHLVYFRTNGKYLVPGILIAAATVLLSGYSSVQDKAGLFFMIIWLTGWTFTVYTLLRQGQYFMGAVFAAFEVGALFMFATDIASPWITVLLVVLLGINVVFFYLNKAPTNSGRRLLDAIEGFKLYLSVAEKERLNVLNPPERTPALFEKYLPYALALDVDQEWSEGFAETLRRSSENDSAYRPRWYSGSSWDSARATRFSSSLSSSLTSAVNTTSRAPGSSSGSGGGSSGGGGGGGGGGGW